MQFQLLQLHYGTAVLTGNVVSAADGTGLATIARDTTFTGRIGTSASVGMGNVRVALGETLTLTSATAADGLYIAGNLDLDSAGTIGGNVALNGQAATAETAAGKTQISLIDGTTTLTALTTTGGAGGLSDDAAVAGAAGGSSAFTQTGAATITTVTVAGGIGGAGMAAGGATATAGGIGGASTATFTSTLAATTVNVTGSVGGVGGAGTVDAVGAIGGAGGAATLDLNSTAAQTITNLNITAGTGGKGGALSSKIGGKGGAGGAASVSIASSLTSTIVLNDGETGSTGDNTGGVGGAGATATLTLDGDQAQVITGTITAAADDEGAILVTNTSGGVTFTGDIGGAVAGVGGSDGGDILDLKIGTATTGSSATFNGFVNTANAILVGLDASADATTNGSSATFKKTLTSNGITLGVSNSFADGHSNTVTFDATGADISVTGAISGGDAEDTNAIILTGGVSGTPRVITIVTDMGANIDTLSVGDYTTLLAGGSNDALTATAISLGSNAVIKTGTATMQITGTVDGSAAGNGTLDIDHNTGLNGKVGNTYSLAAIDIADGIVLTAKVGTSVVKATNITFATNDAELNTEGDATTITGNLVAAVDGAGILDVDIDTTIVGNVGSSNELDLAVVEVASDKTLTVSGNYYAATTELTGHDDSELLFNGANAQTVEGLITTNTAGLGKVTVGAAGGASNVTFNTLVGTTAIDSFTVTSGSTANISNDIKFTAGAGATAGIDINGTLNISSADRDVGLTAVTAGSIDIDGTTKITGANNVTLTAIGTNSLIAIDGTLTTALTGTNKLLNLTGVDNVSNINIGVTAGGTTLNLGNQVVTTGDVNIGDTNMANTINIKKTAAFDPTAIAVINAAGDDVDIQGVLNIALDSDTLVIANNATIKVIDSDEAVEEANVDTTYTALIADGNVVLTDTATIDLQHDTSGVVANDLTIKVVHKSSIDGVSGQNNTALVNALASVTAAVNSTEFKALANLTSAQTENAAEQSQPDAGAAMGAAIAVTGGVNNVIAGRQANTKIAFNTQGKQSGVSTGDAANDAVVWAQVFTSDATQDKVGTIDGYDTDSQGFVVGWEAGKSGSKLGLSLSYSDTDVDGKSAAASHTDTTATQASLYGNSGSTDWMVAYASADNDTTRTINFGGLNRTATGNYNSDIVMAKAGYSFDSSEVGGFTLTPKADLSWTHISNDGYTETGASNLNLTVDSSSNDVVTARAGAEIAQSFESNGAVTTPRASFMMGYDIQNDRAETTSTFTGGGSSFTTQGIDPEKTSFALGFGVDHVSDDTTASFDFNANLKDGYNSNTASLTFKSKF